MKNKTTGVSVNQTPKPEAWIAVSSNRQKIYGNKNLVYLDDNQEFEIELYNPTQKSYLAKIYLNGKSISSSGLVLKPGQRYFLDRFIDEKRKLVFSTYEVEDTKETKKAIEKNGKLRVEFYPELVSNWGTVTTTQWIPPSWTQDYFRDSRNTVPYIYYGNGTTNISDGITFSCGSTTAGNSSFTLTSSDTGTYTTHNLSKSIETGRIESGSNSDQSFGTDYGNYSFIYECASAYHILPRSTKPVDVSEIREYCTECGSRIKKKTWKFCPTCGEKMI
jgi:hypothetical protein